jgi:hypothetical protein
MKNKKAQEEIVGFVIIVVMVVIIGLIFLGLSLRNSGDSGIRRSEEINSFLVSIRLYTTECVSGGYPRSLRELIVDCSQSRECLNKENSCEVLERTLERIMANSTFFVSESSPTTYYKIEIYKEVNDEKINVIEPVEKFALNSSECKGLKMYNYQVFTTTSFENIYVSLEVCKKN